MKGVKGQPLKDMTGETYGYLTVLRRADVKDRLSRTWWVCRCRCGKECVKMGRNLRNGYIRSCGCMKAKLRYASSGAWKNFKYKHIKGGYVWRWAPWHANAHKAGWILEHRLVMAGLLERPLLPSETVHHRNGVTTDNRPENLELKAGHHGKHQSVEDLVKYAREILALYGTQEDKCLLKDNSKRQSE